jgi:hypothetical protein
MQYSGDLKPTILAMGTEINSSSEVTITSGTELCTARLLKPILYVKIGTAAATGSMTISYVLRIAEFPEMSVLTAVIPVVASGGYCYGTLPITSDYSTIRVTKVKNSTNKKIASFKVGLTGLIVY